MNKLFTKITSLALGAAMMIGVGVSVGSNEVLPVKATSGYDTVYTLDTTASGVTTSSNNYNTAGTATVNKVGWSFTGNGQQQPWRLGGKSISNTNRPFYTTSAISGDVDRIEVTFGTASSITVNSFTVSVHSTASGASGGSSALETLTPTFAASSTVGIDLSTTRTDCYYRFVLNVTVSGSSNKFVQISKVEFLQESKTLSSISASLTDSSATWYVGDTVTASDLTVTPHYSDGTDGTPITDGSGVTVTNGSLASVGTNTVNVSYDGKSATVSVTAQAARTMTGIALHGTIEKDSYYVGESWDLTGLDIQVNWSEGDPTYVELDDESVVYECTPATATSISINSFDIEVLYDDFDETFTVSGLTVSEHPLVDTLDASSIPSSAIGSSTSAWGAWTEVTDYTYSQSATNGAKYQVRLMGPSSGYVGRMNNSTNGGFYTSKAPVGVRIKSVSFSAIAASKDVSLYVSNTAYESLPSTTDYVATLTSENLSYTVEGNYTCLAIRGRTSSLDVGALTIEYESVDPVIEFEGGASSSSLTVVNGSTNSITFEAKNFASVSADLFSCSPATGTHSSLEFTVSGTTVTVTATGTSVGGPDSYTISATGCSNTLSLDVTVQSSTTFDSLVISTPTTSTTFNEGDAFAVTDMVVTANFTVGGSPATETFSADSGADHALSDLTFTVGGNVMEIGDSLSSTGSLSVVVSYTDSVTGTSQSAATYSITVNAYVPHTWTLVTSAPNDWRGTYLLGYELDGTFYAFNSGLSTFDATFNTVNTTDIADGVVTGSKELDAVAVKIERNTISEKSYYHAKCANGEYLKSASKGINHQASATAAVAVTFDDVSLKIGDYWLRFNTASNQLRFRFGDSSYLSSTTASLYKMDATSSINSEVSGYATSFLSNVTCSGQGSIVNDGWSDMSTAFAALSVDAQGILANTVGDDSGSGVAGAVGRYDEIVIKHGSDHADFMYRFVEGAINYGLNRNNTNPINLFTSENTGTAVIIIISVIGVTALGGFFFLRRRKEI